jgi:peroxiredoxin
MIAVSVDTSWKVIEDFYAEHRLNLLTLLDPAQVVSRDRYKATGFPETFLIDQNGHIRRHVIGPEQWAHPQVINQIEEMMGTPITKSKNAMD